MFLNVTTFNNNYEFSFLNSLANTVNEKSAIMALKFWTILSIGTRILSENFYAFYYKRVKSQVRATLNTSDWKILCLSRTEPLICSQFKHDSPLTDGTHIWTHITLLTASADFL